MNQNVIEELKAFRPKAYPRKDVFKKNGISLKALAEFVGFSYPHFISTMNGIHPMPDGVKAKLDRLADELEPQN